MPIADHDLPRCAANHAPLTPLDFLRRTAEVHPQLPAIVHGTGAHAASQTWGETAQRCRRMASALRRAGVQRGDVVATLLPNTPPMVEAHFGVPLAGAVLNALNTRLEPASIAYMLDHGEARVILVDPEFSALLAQALPLRTRREPLLVVQTQDPWFGAPTATLDAVDYEDWLRQGDPDFPWEGPPDEWDAIALNYTSGTTGHPKGVVYHHRGAALNAVSNILEWDMPKHPVYLWTLPMFHCNGWCFPWTITLMAGTHVCLRAVRGKAMWDAIADHGVTHMCGAPIVLATLLQTPEAEKRERRGPLRYMVAGAPPPEAVLADGWVALSGETIAAIGTGEPPEAAAMHDHRGRYVLPGLVDGHMHSSSHTGWEGIAGATRSAAAGGITTVCDMPYDTPRSVMDAETLAAKIAAVRRHAYII